MDNPAANTFSMKIKSLIEPLKKVSQATEEEHLGTILDLVESSHEPVFIFDRQGKFLGLCSPTLALFQRRMPYATKASSVKVFPPYIYQDTKLSEVVNDMLSTRFYALPVFDKNKNIVGILRASKIFTKVSQNSNLLKSIAKKLKVKEPVIIEHNKKVKDAHELLKKKKVSRLLVVDKDNKLLGVVTRNDLKKAFTTPSPRQRFSKSSGDSGISMFDEEEAKRNDLPLLNFVRNGVVKTDSKTAPAEIIKMLVKSGKNSIIIVDDDNHPQGLISNRDLLLAISNTDDEVDIPIIMDKPKDTSGFLIDQIENKIIEMGQKLNKIRPLQRFEVKFKEIKNGIGKPNIYDITIAGKFYSGEKLIAKTESHEILIGVREALDKMYKMVRRAKDKKVN